MTHRPRQHSGHNGDRDNRFCGAAVFAELARDVVDPAELLARACGVAAMSADDREVVRLIALVTTSPDVRVWPLKLARTLACYGNVHAGLHGAQLINRNDVIGPGVASGGAGSLRWIEARAGAGADDAAVEAAVIAHLEERGRIGGFGVPLRKYDERLIALHHFLADHPASERPMWRLFLQVARVIRARQQIEPNVAIALSALMLDLGMAPARCGPFLSLMMAHNYAAHALEAADHDGPWLQVIPDDAIDDRSPPLRRSPAATAAATPAPRGPGSIGPRRSLPW